MAKNKRKEYVFTQHCESRPVYIGKAQSLAEAAELYRSGWDITGEEVLSNYLVDVTCNGKPVSEKKLRAAGLEVVREADDTEDIDPANEAIALLRGASTTLRNSALSSKQLWQAIGIVSTLGFELVMEHLCRSEKSPGKKRSRQALAD